MDPFAEVKKLLGHLECTEHDTFTEQVFPAVPPARHNCDCYYSAVLNRCYGKRFIEFTEADAGRLEMLLETNRLCATEGHRPTRRRDPIPEEIRCEIPPGYEDQSEHRLYPDLSLYYAFCGK